ncbi:MAG: hypothetical protein JO322_08080 [Candidatus Eremiobacteraeota bacterium]|nr:hypothetical protein [Candidatus Eremiobacteraeota bacterium]
MHGWYSRTRAILALSAVAFALVACAGNSGTAVPGATSAGQSPITSPAAGLRQASDADKAQSRPSLRDASATSQLKTQSTSKGGGSNGSFTLVTSLAIANDGSLSEPRSTCNSSIFFAPWYWAEGNFSLPLANPASLPVCTPSSSSTSHGDAVVRMTQPFPSPLPTPTETPNPIATNLYVIKVDIGWFDLDITPISGPATVSADGSTWSFPALTSQDTFQANHLYAFFIASWSGTNPPPSGN